MRVNRQALRQLLRAAQIEVEENIQRKDLSESEIGAVQRKLLDAVRQQAHPGRRTDLTGETQFSPVRDRATAVVGEAFGESHKTVERRLAVLEAAEANPLVYGRLLDQMDRDGVGPAHQQLRIERARIEHTRRTEQGGTIADLVRWAELGYRAGAMHADPAWHDGDGSLGARAHYPTMTLQQIADLPVAPLAADNCAVLLWVHGVHLALGNHVPIMRAWGFEPTTMGFTWLKRNASGEGYHYGLGNWTRHGAEFCVLGIKGNPLRLAKDVHEIIDAPIGEHSAKPAEVRRRIERLFAGPYLELFARERVPGWTVWGNELEPDQMAPLSEAAE